MLLKKNGNLCVGPSIKTLVDLFVIVGRGGENEEEGESRGEEERESIHGVTG